MAIELDQTRTLIVALLVLFAGGFVTQRVPALTRYSIPVPVVGGIVFAVINWGLFALADVELQFQLDLQAPLMLMFFTSIGLGADLRTIRRGGPRLALFLVVAAVFLIAQNAVGVVAAVAMDLHPLIGMLAGSITLSGGHGTGAAFAQVFVDERNLRGALELALATATFGLVIGGIIGGPVAQWLIRRNTLKPDPDAPTSAAVNEGGLPGPVDEVTGTTMLQALFVFLLCLLVGQALFEVVARLGLRLPQFVWSLLVGVVIRNLAELTGWIRIRRKATEVIGAMSLWLFLAMALMGLQLWELAALAGPLLAIVAAQTLLMTVFAILVTFRVMGGTYDAAVLASGHCGFGMGATPTAIANMEAVTGRHGAAPEAMIIVPMVGAFFVDLLNTGIITGYLSLPVFGFG